MIGEVPDVFKARCPFPMSASALLRKLESIETLSDEVRAAILALNGSVKTLVRGEDLVREGDTPAECTVVLSGLLCRHTHLRNGGRQIMSFHIPGDMPDLHSLFIKRMDHNLGAVAATRIMTIPHEVMRKALRAHPRLNDLLWRETLIDAAIFRQWMVRIGRRDAVKRLAHLLCEIMTRMQAVGLGEADVCNLPMTQTDLGDALGLSNVHVNRSLQELRKRGLVDFQRSSLRIASSEGLKELADFDPLYLHLKGHIPRKAKVLGR